MSLIVYFFALEVYLLPRLRANQRGALLLVIRASTDPAYRQGCGEAECVGTAFPHLFHVLL